MKSCSPLFNALYQCIQASIRVGLFVSILLSSIVMILGNFAYANVLAESGNTDTQTVDRPSQLQSGGLLFKSDDKYQSAPSCIRKYISLLRA